MPRTRIQEALKHAQFAEQAEVIDVPMEDMDIALLRTKELPNAAFLVWSILSFSTRDQIVLTMPEGMVRHQYPVVCLCCCLREGVDEFLGKSEIEIERSELMKERKERFVTVLEETCRPHQIINVFVRNGHLWRPRFRNPHNFEVYDVAHHRTVLSAFDQLEKVDAAMRFMQVQTYQPEA